MGLFTTIIRNLRTGGNLGKDHDKPIYDYRSRWTGRNWEKVIFQLKNGRWEEVRR